MNAQLDGADLQTRSGNRMDAKSVKTGNGKIANLPEHVREELNWRLNDGEEGPDLIEWLNAKPEVVEILARRFDGVPISEQNLSQWRLRGYRKWQAYHIVMRETAELAQNSGAVEETGIDGKKLLLALKANYASMIQGWVIMPTDQMTYRLDVFKHLTAAVLGIRRSEQKDLRLELDARRVELLSEKKANKSASSSLSPASLSRDPRPAETVPAAPNAAPVERCEPAPRPRRPEELLEPAEPPVGPEPVEETKRPFDVAAVSSTKVQTPEIPSRPPRSDDAVAGLSEAGSGSTSPEKKLPVPFVDVTIPATCVKSVAPYSSPATQTAAPEQTPAPLTPLVQTDHQRTAPASKPTNQPSTASPMPTRDCATAPPQDRPFWPNRRPGAPPRNASPRNPLGLL